MPAQRVLLVVAGFFCLKTAVSKDYQKKVQKIAQKRANSEPLAACCNCR